jgi:hypothetical protein
MCGPKSEEISQTYAPESLTDSQ